MECTRIDVQFCVCRAHGSFETKKRRQNKGKLVTITIDFAHPETASAGRECQKYRVNFFDVSGTMRADIPGMVAKFLSERQARLPPKVPDKASASTAKAKTSKRAKTSKSGCAELELHRKPTQLEDYHAFYICKLPLNQVRLPSRSHQHISALKPVSVAYPICLMF